MEKKQLVKKIVPVLAEAVIAISVDATVGAFMQPHRAAMIGVKAVNKVLIPVGLYAIQTAVASSVATNVKDKLFRKLLDSIIPDYEPVPEEETPEESAE